MEESFILSIASSVCIGYNDRGHTPNNGPRISLRSYHANSTSNGSVMPFITDECLMNFQASELSQHTHNLATK